MQVKSFVKIIVPKVPEKYRIYMDTAKRKRNE